jgi:hypothetical protein
LSLCQTLIFAAAPPGVAGERMVVERPPEGAARGILSVPALLVVVVTAALVVLVIAHLVQRGRRR